MKAKKLLSLSVGFSMMLGVTFSGIGVASAAPDASLLSGAGLNADLKFDKTRTITVEVFDRGLDDGKTKPEDNYYTDFIKKSMLEMHNVNVVFEPVPRWTEQEALNNLLAAGDAPDVCVTYSYDTIRTYADMGGVLDLAPFVDGYKEILPNLWGLLTDINIYYDKDPEKGTIWAIEALLYNTARINTFVREDWLNKLNLPEPTTLEEFESMLYAFKDNAELLLGRDASKMIPFSTSYDIGWRANNLINSFIPDNMTDKELYIHDYDDRQFLMPGTKEAVRVLNKWYNEGLIWPDFPLYGAGDNTELNTLINGGYVGSLQGNWDTVYRDGENGTQGTLQRLVSEDAAYTVVDTFQHESGSYKKRSGSRVDRKLFFPATNDEPVASMLYLDWLSTLENRKYLQIGDEGVTHTILDDGTVQIISAAGTPQIINSQYNIDYTTVINGLDLGDTAANAKAMALGYAGIDSSYIEKALTVAFNDAYVTKKVNVGDIEAEKGIGEALKNKRDALLTQAVVAKPDKFDSVWDKGMEDYMKSGGKAIMDERLEKWEKFFGSADMLP